MDKLPKGWEARADELLNSTDNIRNKVRFAMGVKAGFRKGVREVLDRLEAEGVLWWDADQKVWLHTSTGFAIKDLDWHKEKETDEQTQKPGTPTQNTFG